MIILYLPYEIEEKQVVWNVSGKVIMVWQKILFSLPKDMSISTQYVINLLFTFCQGKALETLYFYELKQQPAGKVKLDIDAIEA